MSPELTSLAFRTYKRGVFSASEISFSFMQDAFFLRSSFKNDNVKVLIEREYFHTEREYHIRYSQHNNVNADGWQAHDASLRTKRCLTKEPQNVKQQSESVTDLLG